MDEHSSNVKLQVDNDKGLSSDFEKADDKEEGELDMVDEEEEQSEKSSIKAALRMRVRSFSDSSRKRRLFGVISSSLKENKSDDSKLLKQRSVLHEVEVKNEERMGVREVENTRESPGKEFLASMSPFWREHFDHLSTHYFTESALPPLYYKPASIPPDEMIRLTSLKRRVIQLKKLQDLDSSFSVDPVPKEVVKNTESVTYRFANSDEILRTSEIRIMR